MTYVAALPSASSLSGTIVGTQSGTTVQFPSSLFLGTVGGTLTGKLILNASSTSAASINIPHSSSPSSPVDGDVWTTTAGMFAQINASTVRLYTAAEGAVLASMQGPFGQCVLAKNGNNISLQPKNGNLITINNVHYVIPDAGVSLAPTGLTANTLYYVYAFINSNAITLEASTTSHTTSSAASARAVEIKTGDQTRTLVGMVYVVSGPAFVDTQTQRFVASWFNRRIRGIKTLAGTSYSTSSNTNSEVGAGAVRGQFLVWANESTTLTGQVTLDLPDNGSAGTTAYLGISYDGSLSPNQYLLGYTNGVGNTYIPFSPAETFDLAEGFHYFYLVWTSGTNGYSMNTVTTWGLNATVLI